MRILFSISSPTMTGPAAPMAQLARRLQREGHEIELQIDSYRKGDFTRWLDRWNIPYSQDLTLSTIARPDQYLKDIAKFSKKLSEINYDAVVAALENDAALAFFAETLSSNKPPIIRFITQNPGYYRSFLPLALLRKMDGLILASGQNKDGWIQKSGMERKRIFCLPPDLDRRRFRPPNDRERMASRSKYGFSECDLVVGCVGRFKRGRGQFEAIRALAAIADRAPHLKLLLVGFGEDLPLVRWLADSLGVGGRIVFTGFLDDGLASAYWSMDAFILPAIGRDGMGRAALEAKASALPVWFADLQQSGRGNDLGNDATLKLFEIFEDIGNCENLVETGIEARKWIEGLPGPKVPRDFESFIEKLRR